MHTNADFIVTKIHEIPVILKLILVLIIIVVIQMKTQLANGVCIKPWGNDLDLNGSLEYLHQSS